MPQQTFLLGMNAKIYQGASGAALNTLVEMDNVKDVSLTRSRDRSSTFFFTIATS